MIQVKKFILLWLPVVAWCWLIYFLSDVPNLSSGFSFDFELRKIAHVTEYAILAALVWRALEGGTTLSRNALFFMTLFFCFMYAISDEWHQSFVDTRGPAVRDILIDVLGALLICLVQRRYNMNLFLWMRKAIFPRECKTN